jgi:hypothetical protein
MLSFWLSLTTTQQGNTAWKEPIDSTADSVRGYLIFGAASARCGRTVQSGSPAVLGP